MSIPLMCQQIAYRRALGSSNATCSHVTLDTCFYTSCKHDVKAELDKSYWRAAENAQVLRYSVGLSHHLRCGCVGGRCGCAETA